MPSFTHYLTAITEGVANFSVCVTDSPPGELAQTAIRKSRDLRYSPIMLAFLSPGELPPQIPPVLTSVAFLFSPSPYRALVALKPHLAHEELLSTYFSEGLPSIVLLNRE